MNPVPRFLPALFRRRRPTPGGALSLTLLSAALVSHVAPTRAAGLATLEVTAERTALRADGRSSTALSVQVRDERGAIVPDGVRVRFSATMGTLDATDVTTVNGVARATLTAPELPGQAIVTVSLESAEYQASPSTLSIQFRPDAPVAETGTAWLRVDGPYVGYVPAEHLLHAAGKPAPPGKTPKAKARPGSHFAG